MGKPSSGPSGTTTSTQNTEPWAPQRPYLERGFKEAEGLYDGPAPQYYPGATYAPANASQYAATNAMMQPDYLPSAARDANWSAVTGAYAQHNPSYLPFWSLASNESPEAQSLQPYMSGERMGKDNPYTQELTDNVLARVLPGIQSQFIRGGTLSSPEAARASASGATSALAPLLFAREQQEAQNQISAAGQSAQTRLAGGAGLQTAFAGNMNDILRGIALSGDTVRGMNAYADRQLTAGGLRQQWDQQAANDAVQRWNWGQELPYNRFNQYVGGVTGNYGGSSVLNQPYFDPPGQSPLSMLGSGVGIASSLFGMFGGSDRRMKDDIKHVGKLDNGLKVYSYRYKDDPGMMRHIGLMADEVEKVDPEAVSTLPPTFGHLAGMKIVDYDRATE